MLAVNHLTGFGVVHEVTPAAVEITYRGAISDALSAATHTFTDFAIGPASAGRIVTFSFSDRAGGTVTHDSATIGGISATKLLDAFNNAGGNTTRTTLWAAVVPTGTTATIVINMSAAGNRCGGGVWTMTGAPSITPAFSGTSVANSPTASINVPANGGALGAAYDGLGGSNTTWSGITEDYDAISGGGTSNYTGAHANFVAAQTGLTMTATMTGSNAAGVFASWGP